jgi:hypothetical protein
MLREVIAEIQVSAGSIDRLRLVAKLFRCLLGKRSRSAWVVGH